MRLRTPFLLVAAVVATGCIEPIPTPNGRFGTITAITWDAGGGTYAMLPEAAFYDKTDLSYIPFTNDTCLVTTFSPTSSIVNGSLQFLDAGDYVQTSVSGRVDSLVPVPGIGIRVYQSPLANGIPFTPGDTLTVNVPGARYPAGSISVRTSEPFTHSAVGVPATGADLPLTWTSAAVGGSQMTFSLRYANQFSSGTLNEQVFCSFIDDGAATIPSPWLTGWISALNDLRETRATRIRSREVIIDTRTRLALLSTFSQPLRSIVE